MFCKDGTSFRTLQRVKLQNISKLLLALALFKRQLTSNLNGTKTVGSVSLRYTILANNFSPLNVGVRATLTFSSRVHTMYI